MGSGTLNIHGFVGAELEIWNDAPYIRHAADAIVACPHNGTSTVGVNQRRLNSEAAEKVV